MSSLRDIRRFRITLRPEQPVRVGGKDDPLSEAENAIAVVGGRLCIPGPSLKGALRAQIERWLYEQYCPNERWKDPSYVPCVPSTRPSEEERRLQAKGRYRNQPCSYPGPKPAHESDPRPTICPACYLLGCMGLVGFVSVPFLFAGPAYEREQLYSSRLDRATGTVAKGANRPYEVVGPDTEFQGVLEVLVEDKFLGWKLGHPRPVKEGATPDKWLVNSPREPNAVIEEFLLDRLSALREIGGYRSKGCGRVEILVTEEQTT